MKSIDAGQFEKQRLLSTALSSGFFLGIGVIVGAAFEAGFYLDIVPGVILFVGLTLLALIQAKASVLSLMPRFLIGLYALPFSVLLGYLFNPEFAWIFTPRGYEIIQDHLVVREMIAIGTAGLCGLAAGVRAAAYRANGNSRTVIQESSAPQTLGTFIFLGLVATAVTLSWLSSPQETIFEMAYMTDQAATAASRVNFSAASLASYILLVALAIDIERDRNGSRRARKLFALGLGVAYVVIVFQLLRGDRESSGLIVALAALYLTSPLRNTAWTNPLKAIRKRIRRLTLPLLVAAVAYVWLGGARSLLIAGTETLGPMAMLQFGLSQNTWTAVLWRNLGTAWEYRHGLIHYKLGQTYLDYLLSLPPGFVTKAFGVDRPLEAWQGIAFEDPGGISAGGLHVVIAPFKNFGITGALCVLFLYGWIGGYLEFVNSRGSLAGRLLWAATLCSGFLWFWYGDMPFIRAIMVAVAIYWMYRVALSLHLRSPLNLMRPRRSPPAVQH
jgi:hypothetical protein